MESIIQSQASHSSHILSCQWCEQLLDLHDFICDLVLAKDLASDNFGFSCFGYIRDSRWQDRISVVSFAILCEKADETLAMC